jgi:PAS domain S-box-containing protein
MKRAASMPSRAETPPTTGGRCDRPRQHAARPLRDALVLFAALVLVAALSAGLLFRRAVATYRAEVHANLLQLAYAAASGVDGDLHRTLVAPDQYGTDPYQRILEPLRRFLQATPGVKYLYTAVLKEDRIHFVVDSALPVDGDGDGVIDQSGLMEVYDDADPCVWIALRENRALTTPEPYTDKWGTFISGFAPLHDSAGAQVGVVGIDITADRYLSDLRRMQRAALLGILPAVGLSGLVGWGFYRLRRREAQRQGETHAALERAHREQEVVAALAVLSAGGSGDVVHLAQALTESAARALDVARVSVWLFDESGTRLSCVDLYEATARRHSAGAVLSESEYRDEFAALKCARYVDAEHALTDPRTAGYVEGYLKPLGIISMLDAVIRSADRPLGALCFEHVNRSHPWGADEIAFACQLADQIALAVSDTERRGVEEALRDSEARYRLLADYTDDVVSLNSATGERLFVSPSIERVTGWTPEEALTAPWPTLLHPDDLPAVKDAQVANLRGDRTSVEFRVRCKNDAWIWLELKATPVCDATGRVQHILCTSRDVTERKRTEQRLRLEELRLQLLVELSRMTHASLQECTHFALEAAVQLTGSKLGYLAFLNEDETVLTMHAWSQAAMAQCRVVDKPIVYPVEATGLWGETVRQRRPVITNDYSAPHPLKKGCPEGHVPVLRHVGVPVFDENRIVAIAGVGNKEEPYDESDVHQLTLLMQGMWRILQRREADEKLRVAHERQRVLLDTAATGVFTVDPERRITSVNQAFCHSTGYGADELLGKHCGALEGAPCRDSCTLFDANRTQPILRQQCTFLTKDGRRLTVIKNATVLHDAHGQITGAVESFIDVTDLVTAREAAERQARKLDMSNRQLEQAIAQAEQLALRAEAASVAKSEFLANMSHEIRTPMTAILGYADLLLEDDGTSQAPETRVEMARTIQRNGRHLLQIINDILDLSKIEAGKLMVERLRCSPAQVLGEVQSLMQVRADAKQLALRIEFEGLIPETIETDPTRLRQILLNLVGNAIKFTEQGSVRLVARLVEGPCLRFDVVDTGIGITPEQMQTLFQPFAQADNSTTRRFGGTGLGLTISRRLAEMLGGTIEVHSRAGAGSTFSVTVRTGSLDGVSLSHTPDAAHGATPPEAAAVPPAEPQLACRILLAEDGPDNQRLISCMLGRAGAAVTCVDNGRRAVDAALVAQDSGQPFAVVLMDMQMPVMDGYEASTLLRTKGYRGAIIALTAHTMAGDREKCLTAGCDDYAPKPIDRDRLLETIRRQLERPPPRATSPEGPPPSLISELAEEADLADLVGEFVEGLPARVDALEAAMVRNDLAVIARLAHQLKGAAGSYGFPTITTAANAVEENAKAHVCVDALRRQLEVLASLCRRAGADRPQRKAAAPPPGGGTDRST